MKNILVFLFCMLTISLYGQDYYVYVTAESEDEVSLIHFDGSAAKVMKTIPVGFKAKEIEGPHGITVAPDGKYWYLSMAHGNPFGYLYKFETGTDQIVGETTLGLFPASMQISSLTGMLFCVNFNLHGDMVPSSVSVVDPANMVEITRIPVGVMPHGSRMTPDGKNQYSVGMMSGEVFEINTLNLKVSRVLSLDPGDPHAGMDHSKHNMDMGTTMKDTEMVMHHSPTKPTWVMPHPSENKLYVAGNGSNEIVEVDLEKWEITDRWPCGKGPYNLDITPDGKKLIVSYKGEGATGVWDIKKKKELARIPNTRKVTHGVAVSSDSRYAFISVEGIGGEPGTLDVIDLRSYKKVASADLGKQAGGIAFWKQD